MNRILLLSGLCIGLLGVSVPPARAFHVFPYSLGAETGYLKWGNPHAGTPGGVVTWSLMPTGTGRDVSTPPYMHGNSNVVDVFNQVGGQAIAVALIKTAFDHWSQVANIEFVYLGTDDGTDFSAPYAIEQAVGDIRIGGFEIDGFSAAIGFAPPPNGGTTLEGDIILNSRADLSFYVAPGAEGELYDLYPPGGGFYRNEFVGLMTHELGHALGLAHSDVPNSCMCGYVEDAPGFDGSQCPYYDPDGDGRAPINRQPDADDVAGVQFLYGAPISADFDEDDDVDGADFLTWQRGVGLSTAATLVLGNADGDDDVDEMDLAVWQSQFGSELSGPVGAAVPEPLSFSLAITLISVFCIGNYRVTDVPRLTTQA